MPLSPRRAREQYSDQQPEIGQHIGSPSRGVHGTFALGYYSPWPPSFVADASLGTGFHVVPQTAGVYVIGEQPDDPRNSVARAISAHPAHIFLLTVHAPGSLRQEVEGHLANAGWRLTRRKQRPGAELLVFGTDAPR